MSKIKVLASKLHGWQVTEANLSYVGSITIDQDLIEAADMFPWQEVFIVNNNNGERFETYIIPGKRGSRKICLNGAAARKVQVGDILIIMSYHYKDMEEMIDGLGLYAPVVVIPDESNGYEVFRAENENDTEFVKL